MTEKAKEPKRVALRNLILLALHRRGNSIRNESGRVSSEIREMCGIPDSRTNRKYVSDVLRDLVQDGLATKSTTARRTFAVALVQGLSEEEVAKLQAAEAANHAFFAELSAVDANTVSPEQQILDKLVEDCETAYEALCKAADAAERTTNQGLAGINGAETLREVGIRGRRAEEVRYYLRRLGLAKAMRVCDKSAGLWWWQVDGKGLDPARLRRMATGDHSYLHSKVHNGKGDPIEDGPRERRFAGATPAVLPADLCSPVTVRRVEPSVAAEPESVVVTEQAQSTSEVDRIDALVGIIERLERESREVQDTVDRLEREKGELQTAVNELRAELEQRAVTTDRADAVIARYSAS